MNSKGWGLLALGVAVGLAVYLAHKATSGPGPGEPGGPPKTGPDVPPSPTAAIFGEFTTPHGLQQVPLSIFGGPRTWHAQIRLWNTNPTAKAYFVPVIKAVWDDGMTESIALNNTELPPGGNTVIDYDVPTNVSPSIFGNRSCTAELVARLTGQYGPTEIHLAQVFFLAG